MALESRLKILLFTVMGKWQCVKSVRRRHLASVHTLVTTAVRSDEDRHTASQLKEGTRQDGQVALHAVSIPPEAFQMTRGH
ncbi:hypothetical protein ACOMHN_004046 [Nucella lapillus]